MTKRLGDARRAHHAALKVIENRAGKLRDQMAEIVADCVSLQKQPRKLQVGGARKFVQLALRVDFLCVDLMGLENHIREALIIGAPPLPDGAKVSLYDGFPAAMFDRKLSDSEQAMVSRWVDFHVGTNFGGQNVAKP